MSASAPSIGEAFLARTVERLLAAAPEASVAKVVIVNQGANLQLPIFQTASTGADERLQVVDQANFGGAGGFARCAIE